MKESIKVRKKPIIVDAMKWTGRNYFEISRFINLYLPPNDENQLLIPTLEGTMYASVNDWIIKGVRNELYPIKEDAFYDTYDILD